MSLKIRDWRIILKFISGVSLEILPDRLGLTVKIEREIADLMAAGAATRSKNAARPSLKVQGEYTGRLVACPGQAPEDLLEAFDAAAEGVGRTRSAKMRELMVDFVRERRAHERAKGASK